MKPERIYSLLRWVLLLGGIATSCGSAWAANGDCAYSNADTEAGGTGMGGTGDVAQGTGIGGTGIRLGVYMSDPQFAGNVILTQGMAEARRNGSSRLLAKGDPVCPGDTIITAAAASVQIMMNDGGSITIRPQTQLKIEKFVHGGTSKDGSLIALQKGACRIVPGKIARQHPQNDMLKTPGATIRARGADHEVTVILPSDGGGYPSGTYDKVNRGASALKTEMGEIDIPSNQVGYAADNGELPALLEEMPGFYNSYPNIKPEGN